MRDNYFSFFCIASVLYCMNISISSAHSEVRQLMFELTLQEKSVAKRLAPSSPDKGRKSISIALGMPISIRLILANGGNEGIELLPSLDPSFGLVQVYLVSEMGVTERFTVMRWETKDVLVTRRTLRPGERLRYETFLFGRLAKGWIGREGMKHEYLFHRPGTYQLFARYKSPDPPLELESNRVTIEVEPAMQGWDALKEAQIVALMEGESRTNAEHRQQLARVRGILENLPENPYASWLSAISEMDKPEDILEAPVGPELRDKVETVFQGFLTTIVSGNIEQCVKLVAKDFHRKSVVWNRPRQREEFQEEIDKIEKLRRSSVSVDISVRFLSVVMSGEDIVIKAVVSYREGSKPTDDQTVRCRLRKHGDRWLIQRFDHISD